MCVRVILRERERERKRETDGEHYQVQKRMRVCVVIGVIGAVGGVEQQGVFAIEGKCRLVIGLC